ncbi:hypothetical protein ACIQW7_23230 [Peribacillus simplex]|uniref:hypothetical protein n=1 Tax=Peribacillus simplex TaxID=1478 RepID=UPI00382803C8
MDRLVRDQHLIKDTFYEPHSPTVSLKIEELILEVITLDQLVPANGLVRKILAAIN